MAGLCEGGNEPPGSLKASNGSNYHRTGRVISVPKLGHNSRRVRGDAQPTPGSQRASGTDALFLVIARGMYHMLSTKLGTWGLGCRAHELSYRYNVYKAQAASAQGQSCVLRKWSHRMARRRTKKLCHVEANDIQRITLGTIADLTVPLCWKREFVDIEVRSLSHVQRHKSPSSELWLSTLFLYLDVGHEL
ncbi:hypothetical protein ANN_16112 [Periplaneta americana]|uniref:Uncharacterized protein n=1 Tax=Periplaneta americana TaxID=6978 RepID=A0ABQ8SK09_PERAM|nr:hypothetical protein ANN_16112 [Periplaneta americana]